MRRLFLAAAQESRPPRFGGRVSRRADVFPLRRARRFIFLSYRPAVSLSRHPAVPAPSIPPPTAHSLEQGFLTCSRKAVILTA